MINLQEEAHFSNHKLAATHCFCPKLAKLHGEKAAVILQGIGHRVSSPKSKNEYDGRKWSYDTLAKKWPYIPRKTIDDNLNRLVKSGAVVMGNYNTHRKGDRTRWYSVPDVIAKRALDDEGKVWFNVEVATACQSIVAGTLYQLLHDDLVKLMAASKDPLARVDKSALARQLHRSRDMVADAYKILEEHGFVTKAGSKYSIPNLFVPAALKKSYDSRFKSEARSHKQSVAEPHKGEARSHKSEAESHESEARSHNYTHSYISTLRNVTSEPALSWPNTCDADASHCKNPEVDRQELTSLRAMLTSDQLNECKKWIPAMLTSLLDNLRETDDETYKAIYECGITGELAPLCGELLKDVEFQGCHERWTPEHTRYVYLRNLDNVSRYIRHETKNIASISVALKVELLLEEIAENNTKGWPLYNGGEVKYAVPASKGLGEAFTAHFEAHPELTAIDVWKVFADCVEINQTTDTPDDCGWDKYFFARGGSSKTVTGSWVIKKWVRINEDISRFYA